MKETVSLQETSLRFTVMHTRQQNFTEPRRGRAKLFRVSVYYMPNCLFAPPSGATRAVKSSVRPEMSPLVFRRHINFRVLHDVFHFLLLTPSA